MDDKTVSFLKMGAGTENLKSREIGDQDTMLLVGWAASKEETTVMVSPAAAF